MNDTNEILTFLGVPREHVQNITVTYDHEIMLVFIDLKDSRKKCPYCHDKNVVIKDYYDVSIKNSVVKNKHMIVKVHIHRYKCKNCGRTFKQNYDFYGKHCSISNETKYQIVQELKTSKNFLEIAREFNVSSMSVIRILDEAVKYQKRNPLPEVLCIDEFCFKHGSVHGKYPSVLSDGLTGDIIDIIRSRRVAYLRHYFSNITFGERHSVKYFVSDMNETYRNIHNEFFHDSLHIIGMFHIANLFNNCVRDIRTRIMNEQRDENSLEYRFLKKNWKIFQMHRDKLKTLNKTTYKNGYVLDLELELAFCLRKYNDLSKAYYLKEEFYFRTRKLLRYKEATDLVNFIITNCDASFIPELNKLGKTIQNWKYSIINALAINEFKRRLSNGIAEANNNVIETLINSSYGLVNFDRMRKRVLYIASSKKTH